jgi:metal-dependent amidase/aminoacylase/carboxypeptidase family protein
MTSREAGTPNLYLAELGYQNLLKLGVETEDWRVSTRKEPAGSTDFSDVTKKIPSLEISISISKDEIPWHSVTAAKATISELGHRALIDGAKALAMTAVDLFAIPENLQKAKSTHLMDLDKYLARSTS